ncbi:MAG: MazG nucleotide pyrophosphohydrolase domain-containing protein [Parachlamydiaceae bacterium]|nr:MazG nucleotide pyrophosphohydrolase domain-containing protein [Parachlamydiaceae bacterium]
MQETNIHHQCLLKQVEQQELEAKEFGFYWENFQQLMDQINSECDEIQEAWVNENLLHLQEEIGDLIQAAISLAVFCKLDPHETLQKSIEKFQKRYDTVVLLAQNEGYKNLHKQSFDKLMDFWNQAKIKTNGKPF